MSFEYYTNWWIRSRKSLDELNQYDENMGKKFKTINDRSLANDLIGGLYAKYCMMVQDLCACVDQLAQPQKKVAVKRLVDSACVRLNELNDELRKISISEYHYIDGTLVELKLIPYDIEILHPCLFHHRPVNVEDMIQRIKNGEKIFEVAVPTIEISLQELIKVAKSVTIVEPDEPVLEEPGGDEQKDLAQGSSAKIAKHSVLVRASDTNVIVPERTPEELEKQRFEDAVMLIRKAEKARQDRVYFYEKYLELKRRKELQQIGAQRKEPVKESDPDTKNKAAMAMQSVWRGHSARNNLKFREEQRRLLIGMNESSWKSKKEFEIFEANLEKRRDYRDQKLREYIDAIDNEKARILRVVAPGLFEDIEDEIREWFHRWYDEARTFDKYPAEEKGGTILVVRGETLTPKEYLDEYERKRREKVKAGGKDAQKEKEKKEREKKAKAEAEKKKKEAERKKKEAEAKKKKKKNPADFEYEYEETLSKPLKNMGEEDFVKIWNDRSDFDNPMETHYMDLITEKECYETQLQVRKQADELMRLELEMLLEALAKDKGKKYKPKKQKKRKKGKKKGKKDITANRLTEDLFQELIDNGIIRQYSAGRLDDFKGDFSYKNTELRALDFDPAATDLDVRQAVALNCIQPLGVEVMKKPRSVLIVGPRQSGKHVLANAVFNHTRCVLFDLSPEVTAGKYPGAKGLAMLIHLVSKMSKLLQPSIIFFNNAEKIFYKKVPKDEKDSDPKRIGKKLTKGIVKAIKPDDRVLVLGITRAPWLAQAAKLKKAFERAILIPRPDYGSVYLYWREFLSPYHHVDRNLNFTSLATVTEYQPYSVIRDVVEKVLTPRRIIQLKYKPLTVQELYEVFVSGQIEPITDKEWKKYTKWYSKTPLGKERAAFNKWADGKRDLERKQQAKQNKGMR
ncbi:dynein regulatory complex protein 11-like [Sitophilus oryzae]|uniref:Dynein regulatory complex protein 11-like n=1 Tax=Sitophilus oryzae TaxID=7048 RepID=A0A6J2XGR4_SITOR|nr:dynein regulatory complex protein 11-like [Sitophilus oryzae]